MAFRIVVFFQIVQIHRKQNDGIEFFHIFRIHIKTSAIEQSRERVSPVHFDIQTQIKKADTNEERHRQKKVDSKENFNHIGDKASKNRRKGNRTFATVVGNFLDSENKIQHNRKNRRDVRLEEHIVHIPGVVLVERENPARPDIQNRNYRVYRKQSQQDERNSFVLALGNYDGKDAASDSECKAKGTDN